ncbi:MAG: peptidylprolyl isomerase [Ketobacteraceae bacterium]|nr:peptidylprolyl isomerase [Ketobacteraceae bacterium]
MRKTLVSFLSLLLLTLTCSAWANPQLLDRIVAVVDDDIIMESELIQRAATIRQKMRERNTPVPPTDVLLEQVLEQMVTENIELQLAERAGIRISDNDINETIKNIARQNNMTGDEFRKALEEEGVSFRELRDQIKREMTITQLRQRRVANRIQVSDKDIENFLNSDLGKTNLAPDYRLGHILIAVPQSASPAEKDAAEAEAYNLYEKLRKGADFAEMAVNHSSGQNALQGGDLGWRKAAQLPTLFADTVLDMSEGEVAKPIRSPSGFHIIKVTDVRGGTEHVIEQTEVQHILIKPNEIRSSADAKDLITDIRERIASGKDSFDDMAKTYSDDPGSALDGGKLGWVNPGSMVPEFEAQMASTPEGELSPAFQTQYGWHILEVTGRRTQDMSEEIRRNRAREMIRRRKFDEELDTWLREIRQNAYVELRLNEAG